MNDPYSTLSGVQFLDEKLAMLCTRVARLSEISVSSGKLTPLQKAAFQLIPASSSLANSIKHLIKEGYLLSALVLFRPLMERVATLSYLNTREGAVALWEAGWPHGQRPSLRDRLNTLMPGADVDILDSFAAAVTKYNSLIHGDPLAAQQSLLQVSEHEHAYALDRDYATPARAHHIAFETALIIVFLIVEIDAIFPDDRS